MRLLNPYLNFKGNTEEAFNFYKSVFGGEFAMVQRFKETPEADKVPEAERNLIMHIALPVGSNILMGTDATESMGFTLVEGNNFSLALSTESEEETDKLYKKLSQGGKETMPPSKVFWGAYFGMLTDKFGIQWILSFDYNRSGEKEELETGGKAAKY